MATISNAPLVRTANVFLEGAAALRNLDYGLETCNIFPRCRRPKSARFSGGALLCLRRQRGLLQPFGLKMPGLFLRRSGNSTLVSSRTGAGAYAR